MNFLRFKIYLAFYQRLPYKWQLKIGNWIRGNYNSDTLEPPLPRALVIDPTNICNLACPLCASNYQNYEKEKMSFETFKTALDKIHSTKVLILFNWGEPLLNSGIFKFIREAVSRNIYTITHTNFSFKQQPEFFERLVDSGLHQLIISADGATQESYEKYRVKGKLEWVLNNIRYTGEAKKKLRRRDPKIIWKFIVNRFNEHELDLAKETAKKLGVEIFFDRMGLSDDIADFHDFPGTIEERMEKWLPKNNDYIFPYYKNKNTKWLNEFPCDQLFNSTIINPDGKITPCCWVSSKDNVWGDIKTQPFEDIWYGENYKYSRSLFNNIEYKDEIRKTVCTNCNIFKRTK